MRYALRGSGGSCFEMCYVEMTELYMSKVVGW